MKTRSYRYFTAAAWIYFSLLYGWLILYLLSGDRSGWLSMVNMLAVYLFLPLPLVFAANLYLRRVEIWIGALLGAAVFAWFWGSLFLPKTHSAQAGTNRAETLTVMSYNVLGRQYNPSPAIATMRAENTDVVLIQELNYDLAEAIRRQLDDIYPYQALDPKTDVHGMGVLSKHPLRPVGINLPLTWIGKPQVLEMNWSDRRVTLVNFHMSPTTLHQIDRISDHNRQREAQAQALVDLSRQVGTMIAGGDANSTPLSDAYQILTADLEDAWLQAGFGLGHTFPGSDHPRGSRPGIAGVYAPMWMARIDYVFFTPDWQAISARLARFDGVSDHRGVVATLKLSEE
jgi:endonuclease/exonuclease/phosphatase (EEP) superfamily protein YafD